MSDFGYVWDEHEFALVQAQHEITFSEVVHAFEDLYALDEPDPQGHPERYMIVGLTHAQRLLHVIYTDEDLPLTRLITAFEANSYWSRMYEQRRH